MVGTKKKKLFSFNYLSTNLYLQSYLFMKYMDSTCLLLILHLLICSWATSHSLLLAQIESFSLLIMFDAKSQNHNVCFETGPNKKTQKCHTLLYISRGLGGVGGVVGPLVEPGKRLWPTNNPSFWYSSPGMHEGCRTKLEQGSLS